MTSGLIDSATILRCPGPLTGAYEDQGTKYVTFSKMWSLDKFDNDHTTETISHKDGYVALYPDGNVSRDHSQLLPSMTNSPLPLVNLGVVRWAEAKSHEPPELAQVCSSDHTNTIYWWSDGQSSIGMNTVSYYTGSKWANVPLESQEHIPPAKYPLLCLAPLTMAVDVITYPIQFVYFAFFFHPFAGFKPS